MITERLFIEHPRSIGETYLEHGRHALSFGWAMLRLGGVELMVNNAYEDNLRPAEPDRARIAAHADTVIYFGCRDVDGAYATLRERGIAAKEPKIVYYGMKQVYVTDPDGYTLCFQWPVA